MKKGVTVEQVARVTRALHRRRHHGARLPDVRLPDARPTQETIDSLERVRQLFAEGCVQSAFWHRFAATAHSPIGQQPELFGIRLRDQRARTSPSRATTSPSTIPPGTDHDLLGVGLRKALYNYMHGLGLDHDVRSWFTAGPARSRGRAPGATVRVPATTVPPDFVRRAIAEGPA